MRAIDISGLTSNIFLYMIFLFLFLLFISPPAIHSQNFLKESNNSTICDSSSQKNSDHRFLKLQSDLVITEKYNTGFGIGGGMGKALFHPRTRLMSVLNFWGASRDSVDVFSLGIEENITYRIPVGKQLSGIAGLTFGAYYNYKKTSIYRNSKIVLKEKRNYLFKKFIIAGFEYKFTNGRTFSLQCKLSPTEISKEIHIQFGLYIHRNYMIKSKEGSDL